MSISTQGASPKTHPILFSGPMIRALLEGRKTQTRRIVKPQPHPISQNYGEVEESDRYPGEFFQWKNGEPLLSFCCPYGKPGDLLWVRETWAQYHTVNHRRLHHGGAIAEVSDGLASYRADGHDRIDDLKTHIRLMSGCDLEAIEVNGDRWRPSIHMHRWASRLTLEITDVRVERLQDISKADKASEGGTPDQPFGTVWRTINTAPGIRWEDNPWVWALTFKVHQCNVDALLKREAA
jgi:hypothetical protein